MSSSSNHPTTEKHLKGLCLDKKYYISDGNLHFKVENTLFCVHSHFFYRESPRYRERMAEVGPVTPDGLSDRTAIPIKNISPEEFSHFLWVFYNEDFIYNSTPASVWKIILRLSSPSRWHFPKIHNLALVHLADLRLPVIERIALYTECSVQVTHLLPLYAELCLREAPLALDESVSLGYELTTTITHVRELLLRAKAGEYTLDSGTIIEGQTVSQEQVIELLKSALETTAASSSILELQKSHQCPTAPQGTCNQPRNKPKQSLRARYNRQATTNSLADVMLAESSSQGKNRSMAMPSSSNGKAPAVGHAQKLFKKTVGQLRIKTNGNAGQIVGVAECVRA